MVSKGGAGEGRGAGALHSTESFGRESAPCKLLALCAFGMLKEPVFRDRNLSPPKR